jgi:peptidylprolyl isomerase
MTQANSGDTVRVHYTGTLSNGEQFDSSEGREPLEFTLGSGQVIAGFDDALTGMTVGENKTVTIPAAEAYGEHNAELLHKVPREQMPAEIELETGMELGAQDQAGNPINFVVVEFDDATVTLDANHPLAGQDLTFALELVEVKAA